MSVTIELPVQTENELESLAAANGRSREDVARDLLQEQLVRNALFRLRDKPQPQSLADLKPRRPVPAGSTAFKEIVGKWPGDESDEEILAALQELS